jgi:hypothetical protein
MSIKDEALRDLAITLKRDARSAGADVDDTFVVELKNYAQHEVVKLLGEGDTRLVLDHIGRKAFEGYHSLNSESVWKTIQKLCRPKSGYDLCANAARNILITEGRMESANLLKTLRDQVLTEWKLDE